MKILKMTDEALYFQSKGKKYKLTPLFDDFMVEEVDRGLLRGTVRARNIKKTLKNI